MSIWRAVRSRARTAGGIVLAAGVAAGASAVPAQARPVLQLPPKSAAVSWGDNQHGQLGNGSTIARPTYAGVSGLSSGVAQVAAGLEDNSMALTTSGTVWTWGSGEALGNGTTADSTVPVPVPGLAGITQISAGPDDDLALRSDGTVWAWGNNIFDQLGDGDPVFDTKPTPVRVAGLTGVTQIAAGAGYGLALRSDGTVWGWGFGGYGQLGSGAAAFNDVPVQVLGLSGVTQIAAGVNSGMALSRTGPAGSVGRTVWTWGRNAWGQLGNGTTTSDEDPEVVSGINVPSVTAIAARGGFSMVLGSDGSVWAWGQDSGGELGNGSTANQLRPVQILSGAVTGIAAGETGALAVFRGGSVLAWGTGLFGTGTSSLVPVIVPSLAGATQVSAGGQDSYTLAVHQVPSIGLPGVPGPLRR